MAKEYIERDAVAKKAICMHGFGNVKYVPLSAIMNQPAADVVEVVRCKDCEYRHDSCFAGVGNTYCDFHHKYFPLVGFCSYGERRDKE